MSRSLCLLPEATVKQNGDVRDGGKYICRWEGMMKFSSTTACRLAFSQNRGRSLWANTDSTPWTQLKLPT